MRILCIIKIVNLLFESRPKSDEASIEGNILGVFLFIIGFVWMSVELFNNCAVNNLTEYKIYVMLEILYWIYVSFIGMSIVTLICICCNSPSNTPELKNDNNLENKLEV